MKSEYKIFFAIPFDKLTKHAYEEMSRQLQEIFEARACQLVTVIGNQQIGPSQHYLDILSFKSQNAYLHDQFFKDIETSDLIVADLTNNNPNVHVELGMALVLNKNILRVTGRDVKELGFDIQNLDVFAYKDKDDLLNKIQKYIERFIEIKRLDFSPEYEELYKKTDPLILLGTKEEMIKGKLWFYAIAGYSFRDGAIRLTFEFLNNLDDESWFGVYLRASENAFLGSFLLYVRKNGFVELGRYPGPEIFSRKGRVALKQRNSLLLEIENDELEVEVNDGKNNFDGLKMQNVGNIWIATWECQARADDVELINRDTK